MFTIWGTPVSGFEPACAEGMASPAMWNNRELRPETIGRETWG
jgi:hypothetical protein